MKIKFAALFVALSFCVSATTARADSVAVLTSGSFTIDREEGEVRFEGGFQGTLDGTTSFSIGGAGGTNVIPFPCLTGCAPGDIVNLGGQVSGLDIRGGSVNIGGVKYDIEDIDTEYSVN